MGVPVRKAISFCSTVLMAVGLVVVIPGSASASRLVSSFDSGLAGLVSVAVGGSDNVYLYAAFDDTIEHEAWNDSDQLRVVLILDLWPPALSEAERRAVASVARRTPST